MPQETQQPFQGQPRKTDDTKLVAEVLGPDAAAEMGELAGDQPLKVEPVSTEFEMSAAEQSAAVEVEETVTPDQRRRQYHEWIKTFYGGEGGSFYNEEWVNKTFIFEDDGSVRVDGDLILSEMGQIDLPPGLREVTGELRMTDAGVEEIKRMPERASKLILAFNAISKIENLPEGITLLQLQSNSITKIENIPDTVTDLLLTDNQIRVVENIPDAVDDLSLNGNPIEDLSGLAGKHLKDLYITGIPATTIPADLVVDQPIRLLSSQRELIADCKAKGHKIKVL